MTNQLKMIEVIALTSNASQIQPKRGLLCSARYGILAGAAVLSHLSQLPEELPVESSFKVSKPC